MSRLNLIAVRVVGVSLLTIAFLSVGSIGNVQAADVGDETQPPSAPPTAKAANVAPLALPAPNPGETLAYFFPTDNDATGTVMYLVNTDSVAHVVQLRGFAYNGVLVYSLNINIDAFHMLRLASDSIAAAPPPSWASSTGGAPAPIITNFTDFTYFASISLPKGVKVDGYVIFNPGTGTVDPRKDQGAIPLRFLTSPFYLPQ